MSCKMCQTPITGVTWLAYEFLQDICYTLCTDCQLKIKPYLPERPGHKQVFEWVISEGWRELTYLFRYNRLWKVWQFAGYV